ncbi:MAG: tol-pal system protein YbgF [Pseudomonadota bacterium]
MLMKSMAAVIWVGAALALTGQRAEAQGVDRYQFLQMEKSVKEMEAEVARLRNALAGGNLLDRLNALEDELSRLTGQLEQLQFAQRSHEDAAKLKLEDLEYRIIELEGGDPSILFQNDEPQQEGNLAPAPSAPSSGGTLGTLTSTAPVSGAEKAEYEAGVAAIQSGRVVEGRGVLEGFLTSYPDSPLAGDAYYWLGESYFLNGEYQAAANRFLDAATLFPDGPLAPDSLLKLGVTLSLLGRDDVACQTLREVATRYPNAEQTTAKAATEAQRAGCA